MPLVALGLVSCSAADVSHAVGIPTPVEYAQRTAVDEQVAVGIENAYKAFRQAVELGVDTGMITGQRATAIRQANNCAYRAVLVFRQAYKTANAADLLAAARSANIAIEQALASFKGENKCLA
jgi:hypothetical protein